MATTNQTPQDLRVAISREIFRGIDYIRGTGVTNMFDRKTVLTLAREWGFHETADWIEANPSATYGQLIIYGPQVPDPATPATATFTILVEGFSVEDMDHVRDMVNDHHGNLHMARSAGQWSVQIVDDNGEVERSALVDFAEAENQIRHRALVNGWLDALEDPCGPNDPVYSVDLGQFDPWDFGACVQVAAFGTIIVS